MVDEEGGRKLEQIGDILLVIGRGYLQKYFLRSGYILKIDAILLLFSYFMYLMLDWHVLCLSQIV